MSGRVCKRVVVLFLAVLLVTAFGCSDRNESNPSDVSGFNYTDYYIAGFRITNEGQELSAGGPNIFPKKAGEERSGGGRLCVVSASRAAGGRG